MTDLEKHVNRPGRDKQVKKVREKINELGITYIYYQFISVTGRVVGKGIPADHWERTAEKDIADGVNELHFTNIGAKPIKVAPNERIRK